MNIYIYSTYGTCVVIFANSIFEAAGYLNSLKDEKGSKKYFASIEDIKELQIPSKITKPTHTEFKVH